MVAAVSRLILHREAVMVVQVHWWPKVSMGLGLENHLNMGEKSPEKWVANARVVVDDFDLTTWHNPEVRQLVGLVGFS